MSKYETKNLTGSLFKNERKEKDTHPDYQGECLIDGKPYYMSAWLKAAESGRRWMSFSFKPKEAPKKSPQGNGYADAKSGKHKTLAEMDDDIPF